MLRDEILRFFAKYIETELGIVYAEHNNFQLQNRLEEIAKLTGVGTLEALYEQQSRTGISGAFKQLLLDVATNNETSFFRDPKIFRAIEETILKNHSTLVASNEKLRVWSAASSTGQEALSIAILVKEFNLKSRSALEVKILGSDISERVLDRARSGMYSQLEVQRGLPAPYLVKYFSKDDQDQWHASPELTRLLEFKKLNLKSPFPFLEKFHLILCRNVLIYQSVEGKKDILGRITASLAPGGYLILGAGESLLGLSDEYEQCSAEGAILYRKKGALSKAA